MELTLHVPLKEWYYFDKQWWGLDYPPLTAYVSLLLGKLYKILGREVFICRGDYIHPEWFELDSSRGIETPGIKSFMRFSVIISDYVLYVPVLLAYAQFVVPAGRKIDKV